MQPPPAPSIPPPDQEPEELAQFREAWKAEVQKKKAPPPTNESPDARLSPSSQPPQPEPESQPGLSSHTIAGSPVPPITTHVNASRSLGSALEIYRRAIKHEQRGELDDALLLYRQAFRMDPDVDRAYARDERIASLLSPGATAVLQKPNVVLPAIETSVDELARSFQHGLAVKTLTTAMGGGVVTGTLASLLANFPKNLMFEAEDEQQGTPLKTLPDELLILILRTLDSTSIERFAAINRKARIVSLDSVIWR
jgi:F-box protein 9